MRPDDQWADLALRVPGGFAGLLYEGGHPVIMLTRPHEATGAKAALASEIRDFPVGAAEVRAVRWDFAQLVDWFNYLLPRIGREGLVTADKDEGLNRIGFGVIDSTARVALERVLDELKVPCDLVVTHVTGPRIVR
jgi:hypothetical protein